MVLRFLHIIDPLELASRLRVPVVSVTLPLVRSMPLLASLLLSAPRNWQHHGWARYTLATSTRPLGTAAVMGLFDLALGVGRQEYLGLACMVLRGACTAPRHSCTLAL